MQIKIFKYYKKLLTMRENKGMIQISQISDWLNQGLGNDEIRRKEAVPTIPFQKIAEACKTTGLSQYYLRQGCKNGTIPHVKSGGVYYINVPALMETLGTGQNGQLGH